MSLIVNELKIFSRHLRILIVEDDQGIREQLSGMLKLFFAQVTCAKDGKEALDIYSKHKFDIVITDINMPHMSGVELSTQIRILNKEQVIVVLSGYIDTFVIDLLEIGVQSLVMKPFDTEKLLMTLLKQCENIVLKKEFDKLKYSTLSKKISNNQSPKQTKKSVENIAKQSLDVKSSCEYINEFKANFEHANGIDDSMFKSYYADIEELNEEFEDITNLIMLNGITQEYLDKLSDIFRGYFGIVSIISNLNDLSTIFLDISNTLDKIDLDKLSDTKQNKFQIFEFLYEDIIAFFHHIFISKEASNINYLTDSLKTSLEQLKSEFGLIVLEEEDLELF